MSRVWALEGEWVDGVWTPTAPVRYRRVGGRPWRRLVRYVVERDGGICRICGLPGATSGDHVISLADGGAELDASNVRAAHLRCNLARSARRSSAIRARKRHGVPMPRIY